MRIYTEPRKFPYILIDNFIPEHEMNDVLSEIEYLKKFTMSADMTGSATTLDGTFLKQNKGIYFNHFYNNDDIKLFSPTFRCMLRLESEEVFNAIRNYDNIFAHFIPMRFRKENEFPTDALLSFYYDSDYYKLHTDSTLYTAVLWIHEEPKQFTGGDFYFHHEDGTVELVECKNNRMVIFPSFYAHEVTAVKYLTPESSPRCSVSMFF